MHQRSTAFHRRCAAPNHHTNLSHKPTLLHHDPIKFAQNTKTTGIQVAPHIHQKTTGTQVAPQATDSNQHYAQHQAYSHTTPANPSLTLATNTPRTSGNNAQPQLSK